MNRFWITIAALAMITVFIAFSPHALAQSNALPGVTDATAPVTNATLDGFSTQGVYTTDVIVTLSASDSNSGINYTEYSVNNGTWTRYTGPVTFSRSATVNYRSVDMAGNTEANNTISISRIHISLGPGISPADGISGSQSGITPTPVITPSIMPETLLSVTGNTATPQQTDSPLQSGSPIVWVLILIIVVFGIGAEIYFLTMRK